MSFSFSDNTTAGELNDLLTCVVITSSDLIQAVAEFRTTGNIARFVKEVGGFFGIIDRLVDLEMLSGEQLDEERDRRLFQLENYILLEGDA